MRDSSSTVRQDSGDISKATAAPSPAQEENSPPQVGMANDYKDSIANGVAVTDGFSNPTASSASSLIGLAQTITRGTEKLGKYLKESGSSMPSFDVDAPMDFPSLQEEIQKAGQQVIKGYEGIGRSGCGAHGGHSVDGLGCESIFQNPSISDPLPSFWRVFIDLV